MNKSLNSMQVLLLNCVLFTSISHADDAMNEVDEVKVTVTAEFEEINVLDLPGSVSVINQQAIESRNAQNLSDILNLAPNVNFATGASRGRFIQIRGVGERSEFSEPVNYSVGVVVDGIDLTGIASAATMMDIQQVEILRGPQGTLYGANGLAGLINIVSNSPTESFYSKLSATVENYGGIGAAAIVSGPVSNKLAYRVGLQQYSSEGFIDNVYLNRQDTNDIDELSLRAKLVYLPSQQLTLTANLFAVDIDNGYDAFSLDSNRDTYSDEPGFDRQKTNAASIKFDLQLTDALQLETIFSLADSKLEYGYDEDWSYPGICDSTACDSSLFGFDWWYASFDNYQRENTNNSVDIRLHSESDQGLSSWVLGVYLRDQQVDLVRQYTYLATDFSSRFETQNLAIYGQINTPISNTLRLTSGLRFESRSADYVDNNAVSFTPDEDQWGGKIALEYHYAKAKMIYGLISRGYKNGGFNTDGSIPAEQRLYDTEFMWNYEAGIKGNWLDHALTLQASLFYQDWNDVQVKQSIVRSIASGLTVQQGGMCPCSFTDYLENAAKSDSYGIEVETQWQASNDFEIYASLGLLKTEFRDYQSFSHVLAEQNAIPPVAYNLSGRSLAHAPNYQAVFGINYFIDDHWTLKSEVEAKDRFYFSDRHQQQADNYQLVNLAASYRQDNWRINFYINNLTDKATQTRGFGSFGNDPRKFYATETYYQFGAPRVAGISAMLEFE